MADFDWSPYASGGATRPNAFSGMNAQFRAALQGLITSAPEGIRQQLQVYSGYRSPETQAALYNRALEKYGSASAARQWVAPPGRSQHGKGFAADMKYLSPQAKAWVRENAPAHGLSFPLKNEPWHVELATARNPNAAKPPMDIPNIDPAPTMAYAATPSPRPAGNPFDAILSPQQPSFPATPSPVERGALADVTPVSFSDRYNTPQVRTPSAQSSYFDYSGLLAPEETPAQFNADRFQTTAPVATTPQQLQRGLLDQQLDVGILPDVRAPATNWPGAPVTPTAPAYTDPMVTHAPDSIQTAAVQPQAPTAPSGLLSGPEAAQLQQQQGLMGGPLQHSTPEQLQAMAAQTQKGMQNRALAGALGGGLLGGLTLGPIGGILGGLLGRTVARNSYFPDAPAPSANSKNDRSLNDYGKSVANQSGQFRDAMSRGGIGLY